MKIRQLGVRFTDIDFCNTFRVMMELYGNRLGYEWLPGEKLTKEQICRDLNCLVFPIYQVFQNRDRGDSAKQTKIIQEWLTITERNIYINEEVGAFLKENADYGDNGEFHMIQEIQYDSTDYMYDSF